MPLLAAGRGAAQGPPGLDSSQASRIVIVEVLIHARAAYMFDQFPVQRASLKLVIPDSTTRQLLEARVERYLAPRESTPPPMPWHKCAFASFRFGGVADSADAVIVADVESGEYSRRETYFMRCRPGADCSMQISWFVREVRTSAFMQTLYRVTGHI